MTRLYDVMSADPVLGDGPNQWSPYDIELAMALLGKNRHYEVQGIQRRHFNSSARAVGFGPNAEPLIEDILARTPFVLAELRSDLPPDISPRVVEAVLDGLEKAAAQLEAMLP